MKKYLSLLLIVVIGSIETMNSERIKENLYNILEVKQSATIREIKKSYYKLARKYHPDKNKNKKCIDKMKMINKAYAILRDSEKRKQYDVGLLWGRSLDDIFDDVMSDDFGTDTYDEEKDSDFVLSDDAMSYGSSEEDSYDTDYDSLDEEKYNAEADQLLCAFKVFHAKKVGYHFI